MMEFVRFIGEDPDRFCGFIIVLWVSFWGAAKIVRAFRGGEE